MTVLFLEPARQELDDAFSWYEDQRAGLGRDFLDEMDRAVKRVIKYPSSCAEICPGIRRCLVGRFPYGLIYCVDGDQTVILALGHLHREPRYWTDRVLRHQ